MIEQLRDKYQQLRDDARRESQSLMVLTDLHSEEDREKMVAVGREFGTYSKIRVYDAVVHLLNRRLSHHKRVHISMEEVMDALSNLAHRDSTTSITGPLDRFIVSEEGDSSLYKKIHEEILLSLPKLIKENFNV
jgi:hypothetical protein